MLIMINIVIEIDKVVFWIEVCNEKFYYNEIVYYIGKKRIFWILIIIIV